MSSQVRSRPTPRPRLVPGFGIVAGLGAGAVLGYLFGRSISHSPLLREMLRPLSAMDLLALPVLVLLVLAVHEGGHLFGGFRRGMRFLVFIVGPFQLSRPTSGVRFDWIFSLGVMGGLAAATPDPERPLRPQLLSLVAGGPLASVLLAAVGLSLAGSLGGWLGAYSLFAGILSFVIFLGAAIPVRVGGYMSDGMQFVEVIRGGRGVEERQALMTLMAQSLGGTRSRSRGRVKMAGGEGFGQSPRGRDQCLDPEAPPGWKTTT